MDETAVKASRILLKFVTDKDAKLRYGLQRRAEMFKRMADGEEPSGYRAEWIKTSVNAVLKTLIEKAQEFNAMYPQDTISTKDFLDVLATTANRVKQQESR